MKRLVIATLSGMMVSVVLYGADVGETLRKSVEAGEIAGVVSVISDGDYHTQIDCAGFADLENRIPMREDTLFAIFSVSKSFCGSAAMILVADGKLDLDAPAEKYDPDFAKIRVEDGKGGTVALKRPVTVRDLLSHTSGTDQWKKLTHRDYPLSEAVKVLAEKPFKNQPGEEFRYNNPGIDAVGRIIEIVSGMPYEEFLKQRIFDPLEMFDTSFTPNADQIARLAKCYNADMKEMKDQTAGHDDANPKDAHWCPLQNRLPVSWKVYPAPSGGLYSTPRDLSHYAQMLAHHGEWKGRVVIPRKVFDEVFIVPQWEGEPNKNYTFGNWLAGSEWFGHEGALRTDQRANLRSGHSRCFMVQVSAPAGVGFQRAKEAWNKAVDAIQVSQGATPCRDGTTPNLMPYPADGIPGHDITIESDARPNWRRIREIAKWLGDKPFSTAAKISDRAAWERLVDDKGAKDVIKRAESANEKPIPELGDYLEFSRNGNRSRYEKPYFRRLAALSNMILAESLENKGRFLNGIEQYMRAICADRSWSLPAHDRELENWEGKFLHGDLFSTEQAFVLATGVYILDGKLPIDLVELVKKECKRRIFDNYLDKNFGRMNRKRANWWFHARENWNAVCNANVVRAALAIVESKEDRAVFVEAQERAAKYFLEGFTPDGYCSEGMGYWNYGFGHHLVAGHTIRAATGGKVNIFANPRNRATVEYAYGFQLESGLSPHFADGGGKPNAAWLAMSQMVFPDLLNVRARNVPVFSGIYDSALILGFMQRPKERKLTREILPVRSWFGDAQVLISRCEPKDVKQSHKLAMAIKGGHNHEEHNHNDLGSYAISMDGVVFSGDPGSEVYTRRTFSKDRYMSDMLNSYGHPVPLVNGKLQETGRKAAAKVLATSFTNEKDELTLDLSAGYAETNLVSLVRKAVFNRKERTIEICDKVEFASPCVFEVPAVTYATISADYEKGMYHLAMPNVKMKLKLQITANGGEWKMRNELLDNPLKQSPARLSVAFVVPVKSAEVTFRYSIE